MKLHALVLAALVLSSPLSSAQASGWLPPQQGDNTGSVELDDRWNVMQTGRFSLHYEPQDRSIAAFFAERAEEDLQRIEDELGESVEGPIHVYVTGSSRDFVRLQPGEPPPWAAATAWPRQRLIFLKTGLESRADLYQTFVHELSHLAVGAALGDRQLPRWFKEGLAQHHAQEWGFDRWRQLTYGIMTGQVGGFADLEHRFRTSFSSTAGIAYAQSAHFFSWLAGNYGSEALPRLLAELRAGQSLEDAMTIVTGQQRWRLEHSWLSSMRWRQAWVPALSGGGAFWGIAMFLTVPAWWRRRKQFRQKLEELDAQEERLKRRMALIQPTPMPRLDSQEAPGRDAFFTAAPLELGLGPGPNPSGPNPSGPSINQQLN